jgi:uncharacterized membrane protein
MRKAIKRNFRKFITEDVATYICMFMSIIIFIEVSMILIIDTNMQSAKEKYTIIHDLLKKDEIRSYLQQQEGKEEKFYA